MTAKRFLGLVIQVSHFDHTFSYRVLDKNGWPIKEETGFGSYEEAFADAELWVEEVVAS